MKLKEEWKEAIHENAGLYFSVYPKTDWNYGLTENIIKNPEANLKVTIKPVGDDFIWNQEHSPIEITASARKLPDWKLSDGIPYQPVCNRSGLYKGVISDTIESIVLIPYGCTKIRVVAFPVVSDK